MTRHEIREWRASDAAGWLACQRACFGDEHAKSEAEWRHLFDAGGHATRGIVAVDENEILAASVGVPSTMWFAGEERTCVHWVDLMVHPDHRRGLGGQRLHRAVAEAFFARYGEESGDLLHFGWPIAPARRFGERFLGYKFVREELCLLRTVSPGEVGDKGNAASAEPDLNVSELTANDIDHSPEEIRWLWDRCAGDWGLSAIRDASWLRARFVDHPSVNYRVLGVREAGVLRGLAVVRTSPWHWEGALALCDWLVPPGEERVAQHLELAVQDVARELGLDRVVTLIPPFSPVFTWFQASGWSVHPTPYQWLIRSFDQRLDAHWMHRHAWFTLADSDLA